MYVGLKFYATFASSKQSLKVQHTDPCINTKEGNSDEELVEVGEQVPLVGEDGVEEAVEQEDEGGDGDCRDDGEKTSDDCTDSHSDGSSTKPDVEVCLVTAVVKPQLCSGLKTVTKA